jgi:hypothetical protein
MSVIKALGLPDTKERAKAEFENRYSPDATPEERFWICAETLIKLNKELNEMSAKYCSERMVDRDNVIQLAIEQWTYNKKFLHQFRTQATDISDEEIRQRFGEDAEILFSVL